MLLVNSRETHIQCMLLFSSELRAYAYHDLYRLVRRMPVAKIWTTFCKCMPE
jgi:hypothetical protein